MVKCTKFSLLSATLPTQFVLSYRHEAVVVSLPKLKGRSAHIKVKFCDGVGATSLFDLSKELIRKKTQLNPVETSKARIRPVISPIRMLCVYRNSYFFYRREPCTDFCESTCQTRRQQAPAPPKPSKFLICCNQLDAPFEIHANKRPISMKPMCFAV